MTQRLVFTAGKDWHRLDGLLASRNVDALSLPFDRFLAVVYWFLTDGATPQQVAKFDTRLWMPPPGIEPAPQSPWSPENETAAFKALRAGVAAVVS